MFGEWIGDKIVNPASTGDFYEGAESFVVRVKFKVTKVKASILITSGIAITYIFPI